MVFKAPDSTRKTSFRLKTNLIHFFTHKIVRIVYNELAHVFSLIQQTVNVSKSNEA